MGKDNYIAQLENTISKFLKPLKNIPFPIHWKLYTLEKMLVQVKHEFNASNKGMYQPEALLAEGGIE